MKILITENTIMGYRMLRAKDILEVPTDISQDELQQLKKHGCVEEIRKGSKTKGLPGKSSAPLIYSFDEAVQLIEAAVTIADIEDVIDGDPRPEVLEIAERKRRALEDELEKESAG